MPVILAYCLPTLFVSMQATPALLILPSMYAKYASVTLTQVGLIVLASRILDVIADPLVGFWSDSVATRWGARKPWIIAGCMIATPSIWFLFRPLPTSGPGYFVTWSCGLIVGLTMISISANAWGAELTRDHVSRSRLFAIRSMMASIGGAAYAVLPIILQSRYGSSEITMQVMSDLAWMAVICIPCSVALMMLVVPTEPVIRTERPSLAALWATLKSNRLLWRYTVVNSLTGVALGMYFGLLFIFFVDHMKLGSAFPYIAIVSAVTGFASTPLWMRIFARSDVAKSWGRALILLAPMSPIIWFIAPGPDALVPVLVLTTASGAILACHLAASPILLSDIIDYGRLRSSANKTGNIFALNLLVTKAAVAGGAGFGLLLTGLFGYQQGQANDAIATFGLAFSFSILPALLFAVAGVVLLRHPVTRARQEIIRRRLERTALRLAAVKPGPAA
jgi:GPH family glycoside/pentoside/hexuronide:cation symporter